MKLSQLVNNNFKDSVTFTLSEAFSQGKYLLILLEYVVQLLVDRCSTFNAVRGVLFPFGFCFLNFLIQSILHCLTDANLPVLLLL